MQRVLRKRARRRTFTEAEMSERTYKDAFWRAAIYSGLFWAFAPICLAIGMFKLASSTESVRQSGRGYVRGSFVGLLCAVGLVFGGYLFLCYLACLGCFDA